MLQSREINEECGVFALRAPGEPTAHLTYEGLLALQHRGQESAGIAVSDGRSIAVHKDMGLVSQVFDAASLEALRGSLAIGHTRYSTSGDSCGANAQPVVRRRADGSWIAVAHNGNHTNTAELGGAPGGTSDTHHMAELLAREPGPTAAVLQRVVPRLKGGYSLVVLDERAIHGVRDPFGLRPLSIGRTRTGGWVLASETVAFDAVGAELTRDVWPGEIVTVDGAGLRSERFASSTPRFCAFEYIYLARPDSFLEGAQVHLVRRQLGEVLAAEAPAPADVVVPVPDSGASAAEGYATVTGLRRELGLARNSYVGRTFIQPSQAGRARKVHLKLNPVRDVVQGRRVVVVDDSLVRGTTMVAVVAMLRAAGAASVHVRISSPPVRWPCFYGVDMPSPAELAGNGRTLAAIAGHIGADSLEYLSLDGMLSVLRRWSHGLCGACFTGDYPTAVTTAEPTTVSSTPLLASRWPHG
jgi:amidophosphoribosyltransferase